MSLIKNYLYNAGYQIFILIIPLITVPYISRVLGSEGVGINAYTNSMVQYFILFGSIGLNLYGNRTIAYNRDDKKKMSQVFWEIIILKIFFISISYLLFLVLVNLVFEEFKNYYLYQSILILAAGIDISWLLMGIEDFKKIVIRNSLVKIVSVFLILTLVKNKEDLYIYILIISISTFLGNLTLWPYLKKIVNKPNWKKIRIYKHLVPSLSLFLPQIATQIYLVLNKTMLGTFDGVNSSGYYENSDKLVKLVLAIVTATGTVMLPRIAHTFAQGDNKKVEIYLFRSFDFVSSLAFPMAFGLAAIAPSFSIWFFGPEFSITGILIPLLCPVIIFIAWSNVLGTQYLLPTNQTRYYTLSVTLGACSNLIINLFAIPNYGIYGAVFATVLSECIVTFTQIIYIKKYVNLRKLFDQKWKYCLSATIMFLIIIYSNSFLASSFFSYILQIIIGFIIYFVLLIFFKAPILSLVKEFIKINGIKLK